MNTYNTTLRNGFRLNVSASSKKGALMKAVLFHPYMTAK